MFTGGDIELVTYIPEKTNLSLQRKHRLECSKLLEQIKYERKLHQINQKADRLSYELTSVGATRLKRTVSLSNATRLNRCEERKLIYKLSRLDKQLDYLTDKVTDMEKTIVEDFLVKYPHLEREVTVIFKEKHGLKRKLGLPKSKTFVKSSKHEMPPENYKYTDNSRKKKDRLLQPLTLHYGRWDSVNFGSEGSPRMPPVGGSEGHSEVKETIKRGKTSLHLPTLSEPLQLSGLSYLYKKKRSGHTRKTEKFDEIHVQRTGKSEKNKNSTKGEAQIFEKKNEDGLTLDIGRLYSSEILKHGCKQTAVFPHLEDTFAYSVRKQFYASQTPSLRSKHSRATENLETFKEILTPRNVRAVIRDEDQEERWQQPHQHPQLLNLPHQQLKQQSNQAQIQSHQNPLISRRNPHVEIKPIKRYM